MTFNFREIEREKLGEIEALKKRCSLISSIQRLKHEGINAIIAEIKRASPGKGKIREIDAIDAAKKMEAGGAVAISVLTDKNFNGNLKDLRDVKKNVRIPVIRKDFIVDGFQVYESYVNGADVVLLIAFLLREKTKKFVEKIHELEMEALVEIHNEEDLKFALDSEAKLIGINNRNLETLEVDISTTERCVSKIPKDRIKISESGIKNKDDVRRVFKAGVDAALIGTGIIQAEDIEEKLREFLEK